MAFYLKDGNILICNILKLIYKLLEDRFSYQIKLVSFI